MPKVVDARPTAKEKKLALLAQTRYEHETSGITVDNVFIATDDRSQAKITGTYNAIQITGEDVNWKTDTGWITLTATQLKTIAILVFNYVQACFKREQELAAAIDEDINTDISLGWPNSEFTTQG